MGRAQPPAPPAPERFLSPAGDPAGSAARHLAREVRSFPNYRARHAAGTWLTDPLARWSMRAEADCLRALEEAGVRSRRQSWTPTPVATAVVVTGEVSGVTFQKTRPVPLILSCEMAARLPALARVLLRHGVWRVDVMSAYRREPRTSFHRLGLGLDLSAFHTAAGRLSVQADFELTPDSATCDGPPPAVPAAATLRAIACELADTRLFSTVLTPNYPGHEDHFHLDARPDDPRIYVR